MCTGKFPGSSFCWELIFWEGELFKVIYFSGFGDFGGSDGLNTYVGGCGSGGGERFFEQNYVHNKIYGLNIFNTTKAKILISKNNNIQII